MSPGNHVHRAPLCPGPPHLLSPLSPRATIFPECHRLLEHHRLLDTTFSWTPQFPAHHCLLDSSLLEDHSLLNNTASWSTTVSGWSLSLSPVFTEHHRLLCKDWKLNSCNALSTKYILPRESQKAQPCLSIQYQNFLTLCLFFNMSTQLLDGGVSHNVDRKVRILKKNNTLPPYLVKSS